MSKRRIISSESEPPPCPRRWWVIFGAVFLSTAIPGCRQASPTDRSSPTPVQEDAGAATTAQQPAVADPVGQEPPPDKIPPRPTATPREGFGGDESPWLKIELLREEAAVGWATGSILADSNTIEIKTEGARRLLLDLSRIHVNWGKRVILRIDGQASQLIHGKTQIKHLEVTPAGRWRVMRGEDAAASATSEPLPPD